MNSTGPSPHYALLENQHVAFIGAGRMAEALIQGLLEQEAVPASLLSAADIDPDRRQHLHGKCGIEVVPHNQTIVANADIVVLAVKPQVLRTVLRELKDVLTPRSLIISIAAGIPCATLEAELPPDVRVVRAMPNTPALVGKGITVITRGTRATPADRDRARTLLSAVGPVEEMEEAAMDAVTAISGSGPAYVFYLMEAMEEAAARMGLEPQTARNLILHTVRGAAELALQTGLDPAALRRQVTSPGGTTAAALEVMDDEDVRDHLVTAIMSAQQRASELARSS